MATKKKEAVPTGGHTPISSLSKEAAEAPPPMPQATIHRDAPKVGRNEPCPCGSGKKYKKCCLQ